MSPSDSASTRPATERMAAVAERLVALTDTLVDDFDVVELLDRLTTDCLDLLDVSAAGILLVNSVGNLDLVACSNEATRLIEVFQLETNQGPCVESVSTGAAVAYTDPSVLATRWPSFADEVRDLGFSSVYAIPLRLRNEIIGALNLFNAEQPPLGPVEKRLARAMADMATIAILQHRTVSRVSELADQLQHALNSRISIEQAKGIIAEYAGVDFGDAFVAIRAYARSNGIKLSIVAGQLVARDLLPQAIITPTPRP